MIIYIHTCELFSAVCLWWLWPLLLTLFFQLIVVTTCETGFVKAIKLLNHWSLRAGFLQAKWPH